MAHASDPSTGEAEAGELSTGLRLGLQSKSLLQTKQSTVPKQGGDGAGGASAVTINRLLGMACSEGRLSKT